MNFNKIYHFLKILVFSKWDFKLPKQKPIMIYDGVKNPFKKYFKSNQYNIFFRRGENINLLILIECLFHFKLKPDYYLKLYIKYASPKIIITAIETNLSFYTFSQKYNIPTILVQSGINSLAKNIANTTKKLNYYIDHIFVFNKTLLKFYNSFVSGKKHVIGSFKNNSITKKNYKKNLSKFNQILYISDFKSKKISTLENSTYKDLYRNNDELISWLYYTSKKYKYKFNILGRGIGNESDLEIKYYNNLLGSKNYNFIKNDLPPKSNFKKAYLYKYVFTIESTLGVETFSHGIRTGFIFNRPYKHPIYLRRVGLVEGLGRKGPNWTTYNKKKEFLRVFRFITKSSNKKYYNIQRKYRQILMPINLYNKKFLQIVKKYY